MNEAKELDEQWVLIYNHRHGIDIWRYQTKRLGIIGACHLVLDYMYDEVDSDALRRDIIKLMKADELEEAISLYCDVAEESMFVEYTLLQADLSLSETALVSRLIEATERIEADESSSEPEEA